MERHIISKPVRDKNLSINIYENTKNQYVYIYELYFTEVAIGAPYEDNGTGAIYIYPGIGECKCGMKDHFTQRIAGKLHNLF
jgi:hypothetical protein